MSTETTLKQRLPICGDEIHGLLASPEFFFRTVTPNLLDATGIDELFDDQTRIIDLDETPVGLWSFCGLDPFSSLDTSPFSGFYHLYFRLRSDLPISYWVEGYEAIVEYLASINDVVRVALSVPELDEIGKHAAEAARFEREGSVAEIIDVALPRPRDFDMEARSEFQDATRRIRGLIFGSRGARAH